MIAVVYIEKHIMLTLILHGLQVFDLNDFKHVCLSIKIT